MGFSCARAETGKQSTARRARESRVVISRGNPFKVIERAERDELDGGRVKKTTHTHTVRTVGSQTFYRTIAMLDLNLLDFRQSNLANEMFRATLFVAILA